jgi:hypothetical protein
VVTLFVDGEGRYLQDDGGPWLHDIHDFLNGWLPPSRLTNGKRAYSRTLFIPSDFPPGSYQVVVGLQEPPPPSREASKAGGEFYGAGSWQAAWRTAGRGAWGSTLRFGSSEGGADRLWKVSKAAGKVFDGRLAVVGEVEIVAPE